MESNNGVRIDKWLWAVRIYKTRTIATDACRNGKIKVNGKDAKPSHMVKVNESIEVKGSVITRSFKVKGLLEKRVSAKIAVDYVEETTPQDEIEKLRSIKLTTLGFRDRGSGRPTKKDRRQTERLKFYDNIMFRDDIDISGESDDLDDEDNFND